MREGLKLSVINVMLEELKAANKKFPLFNNNHEAYAVILEEYEETEEALKMLKNVLDYFWKNVKENKSAISESCLRDMCKYGIETACEIIQVTAMAQKALDSIKFNKEIKLRRSNNE